MNSAASDPALIGLDWGTTSLRAFLIGAQGDVLDQFSKSQGIMNVTNGDFEGVFRDLIARWMPPAGLPVIASGMITSRNGWVETPYVQVPSGARELADALVTHETSDGVTVTFVTGMSTEHDGAPDVMRGEETQIIGAFAHGITDGVFVMPGTHSKWITVRESQIEDYATFMTGDVFAALRNHTILGTLMTEGPFDESAFRKGCAVGLNASSRLLHDLFSVRTLPLFGKIASEAVEDYLSGMLIGAELKGIDYDQAVEPITIVGRSDLSDRYEIALGLAGYQARRAPDDIVAWGHFLIARAAEIIT